LILFFELYIKIILDKKEGGGMVSDILRNCIEGFSGFIAFGLLLFEEFIFIRMNKRSRGLRDSF
jgi:hypothetical protein